MNMKQNLAESDHGGLFSAQTGKGHGRHLFGIMRRISTTAAGHGNKVRNKSVVLSGALASDGRWGLEN